jgi:hypothetical protein
MEFKWINNEKCMKTTKYADKDMHRNTYYNNLLSKTSILHYNTFHHSNNYIW